MPFRSYVRAVAATATATPMVVRVVDVWWTSQIINCQTNNYDTFTKWSTNLVVARTSKKESSSFGLVVGVPMKTNALRESFSVAHCICLLYVERQLSSRSEAFTNEAFHWERRSKFSNNRTRNNFIIWNFLYYFTLSPSRMYYIIKTTHEIHVNYVDVGRLKKRERERQRGCEKKFDVVWCGTIYTYILCDTAKWK